MGTVWPTKDKPGRAVIAPTTMGTTYGIWWFDFEAMERRGGYSGPYPSREEAEAGANSWADYWDAPITIEHREERPA